MKQKWNLQDIRPAEPRKSAPKKTTPQTTSTPAPLPSTPPPPKHNFSNTDSRRKSKKPWFIALSGIVVIIGAAIVIGALTAGASITVSPKHRSPNVNADFTAVINPENASDLIYEVLTLEAEGERQVAATGQEEVQSQAEGTITIYNNHTTDTVRLVTNTRFADPDGKIFKIKESVVIPGYTTNDGERTPGRATAEVYADEIGEAYNIAPTRFTIPGFAGSPEFDAIYGESTTAFSGGFDGLKFIIDEAELSVAQTALRQELRTSLLDRLPSELPAGFVDFPDAVTFTYQSLPATESGDNLATIKERAYLRIPLFTEADFASFIAASTIPGYENEAVRIADTSVLSFAYSSSSTASSDISSAQNISFSLTGRPLVVWEFDDESLKNDLAGKQRTALTTILSAYPTIEEARAVIRPFWKSTFPVDPEAITIEEVVTDPTTTE